MMKWLKFLTLIAISFKSLNKQAMGSNIFAIDLKRQDMMYE